MLYRDLPMLYTTSPYIPTYLLIYFPFISALVRARSKFYVILLKRLEAEIDIARIMVMHATQ